MRGRKNTIKETLMHNARIAAVGFSLLGAAAALSSCAALREEFNASRWRYQPVADVPPSWENDYGRPDMSGGEDPWY